MNPIELQIEDLPQSELRLLLSTIVNKIDTLTHKVERINVEMHEIKSSVQSLTGEMHGIKSSVQSLTEEMHGINISLYDFFIIVDIISKIISKIRLSAWTYVFQLLFLGNKA